MGELISFKRHLFEAINSSSVDKASAFINAYFSKELGTEMFPTFEKYSNASDTGVGLRFYVPKAGASFRLNWSSPNAVGMVNVRSLDVWMDSPIGTHFEFNKEYSLVKILPMAVGILKGERPRGSANLFIHDDKAATKAESRESPFRGETLTEAIFFDPSEAFDGVMKIVATEGGRFSRSQIYSAWKMVGVKIWESIYARHRRLFEANDVMTKFRFLGSSRDLEQMIREKSEILGNVDEPRVVAMNRISGETYDVPAEVEKLEANIERLSYEKQLEDLENLIRLTVSGASNALFVAGRGGIGKTHTVEKVLESMNLRDGQGYFKNTGTASAAGIYALLFRYQDKIILFDDSDDALKDQEARNIIKAATDTKKSRKLVWNKRGSNIVEPDDESFESSEDMLDQGMLPRYFEFTGRVIFISNLPMDKLDPDGAIRTRAFLIDINPTDEEVYTFMAKIVLNFPLDDGLSLGKNERLKVVELLKASKSKQTANLRKLSRGLNMLAGAQKAGVAIADADLKRMIEMYA